MGKSLRTLVSSSLLITVTALLLAGCGKEPELIPTPEPTRDVGLEQTFEQQLGGMNPDAIPVYRQATTAMDAGDYATSQRLYEQVLVMAPGFATAYRRLGTIELNRNNLEGAISLFRKAIATEASGYNQSALAMALLMQNTPAGIQEAFDLATEAAKSIPDDDFNNLVLVFTAASLNNEAVLRQADERLLRVAPYNPYGHYFAGVLAAIDGKWEKAESELRYSQRLGMDPEAVKKVLDDGVTRNAGILRFLRWGAVAIAGWLFGLGLLYLAGVLLSKATLRSLNRSQPGVDVQVQPAERRVRSIYRTTITILSLYYYFSIPFVILTLILVVGGIYYVFYLIGRFPVQLMVFLAAVVVVSLIAVIRSTFTRLKDSPPGRELSRIDAPELWMLVDQVAHRLEIRSVDAIYVSPGAGIAVNEKGNLLRKMRGSGRRNLVIGMGVLPGLTQGQFAAILAHEYGHFTNRDTAGGNLAAQVSVSLNQVAYRLVTNRANQFFNPVWLFVLGYHRIFLRVTQGASRLQEILADRYASIAYGSTNFIEGLKNIIQQALVFQMKANHEVRKSLELNRPISNIYTLPVDDSLQNEMKQRLEADMNRTTSAYDSHPSPQERIAWIERMHLPYSPTQDNSSPALDLLPNPEQLQREMTARIIESVRR